MNRIEWTRLGAGEYGHLPSKVRIWRGQSGNWFVTDESRPAGDHLVASAPTLGRAKVAAKPFVITKMGA